jgi:aminopeptidase YwaD
MKELIFDLLAILFLCNSLLAQNSLSNSSKDIISISQDSLKSHVYFLAADSMEGRYPGTTKMELVHNFIAQKFKESGIKPLAKDYFQEFSVPPTTGKNVIGVIEGSNPVLKNEYILIGAHCDHLGWKMKDSTKEVFNGADDNASGSAGLIEIGRKLVQNKNLLKRSVIIIAFDGEEEGLLGSKYFIEHSLIDKSRIKAMFSLDMIGWLKEGKLEISGCGSFDGGTDFMNKIQKVTDLKVEYLGSSSMWKDRTDTRPFYDQKIPCFYVSTGLNSPYHKPQDDADLIDYGGMVKVCEQVYNTVIALASKNEMEFTRTREFLRVIKEPFRIGFNLSYNTNYHNYSDGPFIAKPLFGFGGGLFTDIKLSKYFALQPEFNYSYYGTKSPQGNVRLHSAELPVSLLFYSPTDIARVFVHLGGFVNYSFAGSVDNKQIDWAKKEYNRIDYGIQAGVGLEIFNIVISFSSKQGLNNFYKKGVDGFGKATNIGFKFSLGYYFLP